MQKAQSTFARKQPRECLLIFAPWRVLIEKSFRLVSDRSGKASVTRLHREISFSAPGNLNRWKWNISASRAKMTDGFLIGDSFAWTGFFHWEEIRRTCAFAITKKKNCHSTLKQRQILNTAFHGAGESYGELPTARIMIFHSI